MKMASKTGEKCPTMNLHQLCFQRVVLNVDINSQESVFLQMVPAHCAITNRVPGASAFPYRGCRICIDNGTFREQPGVQPHLGTTYMDDTIQWCLAISAETAHRAHTSIHTHIQTPFSLTGLPWCFVTKYMQIYLLFIYNLLLP